MEYSNIMKAKAHSTFRQTSPLRDATASVSPDNGNLHVTSTHADRSKLESSSVSEAKRSSHGETKYNDSESEIEAPGQNTVSPLTDKAHFVDTSSDERSQDDQISTRVKKEMEQDASLHGTEMDSKQDTLTSSSPVSRERPLDIPSTEKPKFIDYQTGGCQISFVVAIDFTASNGDPRQQGTPHYFHPPAAEEQWNDYEKAIHAVGSILAKYDSDQRFPVWGFGAKYNNVVRHCFQCGPEAKVQGVQGIMDAYRGVFRTPLTMSYPTKFTEVITMAANYARHNQDVANEEGKLSYTILLILTAGNVENVQETKEQLIEASNDPLSVVIVGIGEADFCGMEVLDTFNPAVDTGRHIAKFVRFNDYRENSALTEAAFDATWDQLVSYYFEKGIMPGKGEGSSVDLVEVQEADDVTLNPLG